MSFNFIIFIKLVLNRLGNYIGKAYLIKEGCVTCKEDTIVLDSLKQNEWPDVTVGIFIEEPTPFLREFFERFSKLNYPKSKISLLVHNNVDYHDKLVESFFIDNKDSYNSLKYLKSVDDSPEHEARTEAL